LLSLSSALTLGALTGHLAAAQDAPPPGQQPAPTPEKVGGSPNVHLVGHIPLGGYGRVTDADLEQELSRPYAYVGQTRDHTGLAIIDLRDLKNVRLLYRWQIENIALHAGSGLRPKYFKLNNRYYVAECFQFRPGTPDGDLGAIIFDVTGLPDTSKVKVVARINFHDSPGGFHDLFAYKHSDGRVLLFTTTTADYANVYDMAKVLAGDTAHALIGKVPVPPGPKRGEVLPGFGPVTIAIPGYHDFYVAYDPARQQDKFYGAGGGGYYIYDVSKPEEPKLVTSIIGPAGVAWGHTFTPSPDGNFAVTETEYQWAPLRIFDLRPGLDGKVPAITQPTSIYNTDWNDLIHNHEVRWPYVFASSYEDGLQIFNMQDAAHPKTKGWYYTCECTHATGMSITPGPGTSVYNGAFGVMVRNTDGLIMISDSNTGAWFFKMDGFTGWNGEDWGMPNISSAQDWDHGPPGARRTLQ
jgi:hypothetical protein